MPFVSTDPASWTEDNLDDQNRPTLQAVIDGLGLVLDKDDTRRGRYKGKSRFVKADLIRGLATVQHRTNTPSIRSAVGLITLHSSPKNPPQLAKSFAALPRAGITRRARRSTLDRAAPAPHDVSNVVESSSSRDPVLVTAAVRATVPVVFAPQAELFTPS